MDLDFKMIGNVGVIKLSGTLDLYNASEFKEAMTKYSEQTVNFVIDLAGFKSYGGDWLAVLVAWLKKISDQNGDIRIANLPERIRQSFETPRAYKIFEIFEDVDTAVKSYQIDKN